MKTGRYISLAIITALLLSTGAYSQWVPETPIYGGPIEKMIRYDSINYLLSQRKLFKSNSVNQDWNVIDSMEILDFDVDRNTGIIYCIASNVKLYRSIDNGESWEFLYDTFNPDNDTSGERVKIFDSKLYFYGHSLLQSEDFGHTWKELFEFNQSLPTSIEARNDTIFLGTESYGANTYGLQFSTDNGNNWQKVDLPGSPNAINRIKWVNDLVLLSVALDEENYIIASFDNGSTWQQVENLAGEISNWRACDSHGDTIMVAGGNKCVISLNAGVSWELFYITGAEIRSLSLKDSEVFVGTEKGVEYSKDFGENWFMRNRGIVINAPVEAIANSDEALVILRYLNGPDPHYKLKSGASYKQLFLPDNSNISFIETIDSLIWIETVDQGKSKFYVTSNFGQSYSTIDLPNDAYCEEILLVDGYYLMSRSLALYRSFDGVNWEVIDTDSHVLRFPQTIGNKIYGLRKGLVVSEDGGFTWSNLSLQGLDTVSITGLAASDDYLFLSWYFEKQVSNYSYIISAGVYRYDEEDLDVIIDNKPEWSEPILYTDDSLLAIVDEGNILLSKDNGNTITNYRGNLEVSNPIYFTHFDDTLYVYLGLEDGLWKRDEASINYISLPIPYNLQAIYDDGKVSLSWKSENGEHEGFILERLDKTNFVEIARIPPDMTTYTDVTLPYNSHRVAYRVLAYSEKSRSRPSEIGYVDIISSTISQELQYSHKVYPNPSEGEINIELESLTPTNIELFDISGRKVNFDIEITQKSIILGGFDKSSRLLILKLLFPNGTSVTQKVIVY